MGYAGNRERGMCQLIKEYVHGERETVEVGVNAEEEMKSKPSIGQSICQDNHKVTKDSLLPSIGNSHRPGQRIKRSYFRKIPLRRMLDHLLHSWMKAISILCIKASLKKQKASMRKKIPKRQIPTVHRLVVVWTRAMSLAFLCNCNFISHKLNIMLQIHPRFQFIWHFVIE